MYKIENTILQRKNLKQQMKNWYKYGPTLKKSFYFEFSFSETLFI